MGVWGISRETHEMRSALASSCKGSPGTGAVTGAPLRRDFRDLGSPTHVLDTPPRNQNMPGLPMPGTSALPSEMSSQVGRCPGQMPPPLSVWKNLWVQSFIEAF